MTRKRGLDVGPDPSFRRGRWEASLKSLAGPHERRGTALAGREEHPLQLVDDPDHEADDGRVGLAAESDLLDVALDMPFGMRAVAEEDDVADTIALRRHAVAFEHDR